MTPPAFPVERYETSAVYTHPDAQVDIVLVHGLNGDPQKTWTASNGTFWPTDLLPASLKGAKANILVYGYNADVYSRKNDRSASDNFIHQHAQTLVTNLTMFRKSEGTYKNPIIWVCHSLGGILVKRALLYSNDVKVTHHEDYRSIFVSTFGLIFLGTPHCGSDAATWGLMLQGMADAIMPRKLFESESVLLKTLKKDNETLANINNHFLDIYQRFRIHMVHENHKTDIKGTKITVVDASSASPQLPGVTYYGVEATHSQMCKFASPNAPGYRAVSTDIRQWVDEAPALINVRWEVEEQEKAFRMRQELHERMSPFVSPSSPFITSSHPRHSSDLSSISSLSLSTPASAVPRSLVTDPAMLDFPTVTVGGRVLPPDEMQELSDQLYKLCRKSI
ncbi:hypothetical protein C2857_007115 [Epichloe festucae Fl1]|uniref:DUF676 domain-containing protein n=1 Tax=Epichloe festucae (strain Fl1) TaxID=877507 RepID=A0A7S9PUR2_EPIFF|nr:hypothetical protein C2857_007115 [Epichloe festucae Fl1]